MSNCLTNSMLMKSKKIYESVLLLNVGKARGPY